MRKTALIFAVLFAAMFGLNFANHAPSLLTIWCGMWTLIYLCRWKRA